MEFETAKQAAERLGVTVRAVQKWAKQNKLEGAVMHGNSWLIPKGTVPSANHHDSVTREESRNTRMPLPLLSASFDAGKIKDYIDSIEDADDRNIALAEYFYYTGDEEKTLELLEPYISSDDSSLRYSAGIMCAFSNIFKGHVHIANYISDLVTKDLSAGLKAESPPEIHALEILAAYIGSVIFQLPMPSAPKLEDYLKYLPNGTRLYGCYVLAYESYKNKDYGRAVGICDIAHWQCATTFIQ